MTRGFAVILFTVALDAVGVGLAMPVLPGLLRALGHGHEERIPGRVTIGGVNGLESVEIDDMQRKLPRAHRTLECTVQKFSEMQPV